MRRFRLIAAIGFAVVALHLCALYASAQAPGLGRINGFVTDQSGTPISDVQIQTRTSKGTLIEAKTGAKGDWVVAGLGRGQWDVDFVKDGFKTVRAQVTIDTELRRTEPIRITLKKL